MPIKYKDYHQDWKDIIRPTALKKAGYKCEECGISNRQLYINVGSRRQLVEGEFEKTWAITNGYKLSKVVLSVAHINHDITDNKPSNLKVLCQLHHLRFDGKQHAWKRKINAGK